MVTGRLATLEEIVAWQPYDQVGWRLAVPGVGPVDATVDLEPVAKGTHLRVPWDHEGEPVLDPAVAQRVRDERGAALGRLVRILERSPAARR